MIKEIKYSGLAAIPSDRDCPDGDLAAAINLIPEDGALRPVLTPAKFIDVPQSAFGYTGIRFIGVHAIPSSGVTHYVFAAPCPESEAGATGMERVFYISSDNTAQLRLSGIVPAIASMTPFGNFIILNAADSSLDPTYLRWCDSMGTGGEIVQIYETLSRRPPDINIGFSLLQRDFENQRADVVVNNADTALLNNLLGQSTPFGPISINWLVTEREKMQPITEGFHAIVNKAIHDCLKDGCFVFPFLIRYALRLFDGSYSCYSAPVLMIPSTDTPVARISSANLDEDTGKLNLTLDLGPSSYGHFTGKRGLNPCSLRFRIIPFDSYTLELWKDFVVGIDIFVSPQIYQYSLDDTVAVRDSNHAVASFGNFLPDGDTTGGATYEHPHDYSLEISARCLAPVSESSRKSLPSAISEISNFYRIATIPFDQIIASDSFIDLELEAKDLNNLVVRPTLPDEFHSRDVISSQLSHSYNSRLHLGSITCTPAPTLSPSTLIPHSSIVDTAPVETSIVVYLRKAGVIVRTPVSESSLMYSLDSVAVPRFLFYPDPDAFLMVITRGSNKYSFPLVSHDFLNGSYWVDHNMEMSKCAVAPSTSSDAPRAPAFNYQMHGQILVSDPNNPFQFSASSVVSIDAGRILSISSAAKALSQGQFGQFPLYAFTDQGVWALALSATGTYTARQPITRDVILSGTHPLQLDSEVLFATDRGLMLLSGSQTQCISDTIASDHPFDVLRLPGMSQLHAMLGHPADSCLPTLPFLQFLSCADMSYDYVHQRVILFNPTLTYAYVYSLRSRQWGMMHSTIQAAVSSYPEALVLDRDGNILNLSATGGTPAPGLFVTRPLKIDAPDILKTIDTLIQRGDFQRGHVASVLYGSRDLINWHIIWSSRDHCLRGFRGTPYKYFRIAGIATLTSAESISGATVQLTPRLTDRPR